MTADRSTPFSLTLFRAVLWTAAGAAIVRLLYFVEHLASPFATVPVLDARHYDSVARALAAGQPVDPFSASFRSLAYPAILTPLYRLDPEWGMVLAGALQHLAGIATAALVAVLAVLLSDRPAAGLAAGLLFALAGPPLYFEGELLTTSLFTLFSTLHLVAVSRIEVCKPSPNRGQPGRWLLAGVSGGLAAVLRPTLMPVLAAYPLMAWFGDPARRRQRLIGSATGLGAALLVLAASGLAQSSWVGHWQLLPTASGINFYLGNKAGADGRTPRQDEAATYAADYRDSVEAFAEAGYRRAHAVPKTAAVDPRLVSSYWRQRGRQEIVDDPGRWLGLMLRKAAYWTWNREISNNKSYAFVASQESRLLEVLPVRWWLLLALAPLGAVAVWRAGDRGRLMWLVAQVVLYAVGVSLFFVNARYRLPLWAPMAVLAGCGAMSLWQIARNKRWSALAGILGLAGVIGVWSLANLPASKPPSAARDYFFRSIAHYERGNIEAAMADAESSLALEPDEPTVLLQLATAQLAAERPALALDALDQAARGLSSEPRIHNLRGIALERLGRPAEGYAAYREALRLLPDFPPALINAALLELRAGWSQRATEHLETARLAGLDSVRTLVVSALLAGQRGDSTHQQQLLKEARERSTVATERLLQELSEPLDWGPDKSPKPTAPGPVPEP